MYKPLLLVLRYLAVFLVWNVILGLFLVFFPAPLGVVGALLFTWTILPRYFLAPARLDLLSIEPMTRDHWRWTLASIPALLLFSWSSGEVYTFLVPVPPEALNPFPFLLEDSMGRLSLALLAIGVAPIVEELFFRGLIQGALARRWSASVAVLGAALLFAAVHFNGWVLPVLFLLGAVFGGVAWAARSLWPAVVLHAANNVFAVVGLTLGGDAEARPTLWEQGATPLWWAALLGLLLSTWALLVLLRKLRDSGHAR